MPLHRCFTHVRTLDYKLRHSFFYTGSVSIKFLSVLKITLAQVIEKST